jgi:hypothetical protein
VLLQYRHKLGESQTLATLRDALLREVRLLLEKACDSLLLSIELFNRPHDRGRVSGTLIHLDHAFEMLLKAAILDDQALTLQTINGLRDAAQHHLLDISEGQLYFHEQSGVTLFRDLLKSIFKQDLVSYLPSRVLPVSTVPPTDLATLFDSEVSEIEKLLRPGRRRRIEAEARLKPLAILDAALRGEKGQPSSAELRQIRKSLLAGKRWPELFKGVAAVQITTDGSGPTLSLRLTKKEGIPIQLVPEGTPGAAVVAVKRVNELDFYSLGAKQLAQKVNLTMPKAVAVVDHLRLRKDDDCYKEFRIGSQVYKRYSPKAIEKINLALQQESADAIWEKRYPKRGAP